MCIDRVSYTACRFLNAGACTNILLGKKNWEFDNVYIYFSLNCLSLRNSVWKTVITARCKHGDWMEFNVGMIVHIYTVLTGNIISHW